MTRIARARAAAGLISLWLLGGCDDDPPPRIEGSASGALATELSGSAYADTSSKPAVSRPTPSTPSQRSFQTTQIASSEACRVIRVEGEVTLGEAPLTKGVLLDGQRWLHLASGGSVTIKHGASAREYRVSGPGRAIPCHQREEQVLIHTGSFQAGHGFGARPGAVVLVATPRGVVRYGDAELRIKHEPAQTLVEGLSGTTWLDPAEGVRVVGKTKLIKGTSRFVGTTNQAKLIDACEARASRAEASAAAVLRPEPAVSASLGERAAAQVKDRVAARSACLVARAALGPGPHQGKSAQLVARLDAADARRTRVPGAGSGAEE